MGRGYPIQPPVTLTDISEEFGRRKVLSDYSGMLVFNELTGLPERLPKWPKLAYSDFVGKSEYVDPYPVPDITLQDMGTVSAYTNTGPVRIYISASVNWKQNEYPVTRPTPSRTEVLYKWEYSPDEGISWIPNGTTSVNYTEFDSVLSNHNIVVRCTVTANLYATNTITGLEDIVSSETETSNWARLLIEVAQYTAPDIQFSTFTPNIQRTVLSPTGQLLVFGSILLTFANNSSPSVVFAPTPPGRGTPSTTVTYSWEFSDDNGSSWSPLSNQTEPDTPIALTNKSLKISNIVNDFFNGLYRIKVEASHTQLFPTETKTTVEYLEVDVNVPVITLVPELTLHVPPHVVEGDDANIEVRLSLASNETVTVDYYTEDGTATAPADYTATAGSLTFLPGETLKNIIVSTSTDGSVENTEYFRVVLDNPINATASEPAQINIDDDDYREVTVTSAITVGEGSTVAITVRLNKPAQQVITVDYTTANGTAIAPGDYTPKSGTITFNIGEQIKYLTVDAKVDNATGTTYGPVEGPYSNGPLVVGPSLPYYYYREYKNDLVQRSGYVWGGVTDPNKTYQYIAGTSYKFVPENWPDYTHTGTIYYAISRREVLNYTTGIEQNETYRVIFTNPTNAVLGEDETIVTIVDGTVPPAPPVAEEIPPREELTRPVLLLLTSLGSVTDLKEGGAAGPRFRLRSSHAIGQYIRWTSSNNTGQFSLNHTDRPIQSGVFKVTSDIMDFGLDPNPSSIGLYSTGTPVAGKLGGIKKYMPTAESLTASISLTQSGSGTVPNSGVSCSYTINNDNEDIRYSISPAANIYEGNSWVIRLSASNITDDGTWTWETEGFTSGTDVISDSGSFPVSYAGGLTNGAYNGTFTVTSIHDANQFVNRPGKIHVYRPGNILHKTFLVNILNKDSTIPPLDLFNINTTVNKTDVNNTGYSQSILLYSNGSTNVGTSTRWSSPISASDIGKFNLRNARLNIGYPYTSIQPFGTTFNTSSLVNGGMRLDFGVQALPPAIPMMFAIWNLTIDVYYNQELVGDITVTFRLNAS